MTAVQIGRVHVDLRVCILCGEGGTSELELFSVEVEVVVWNVNREVVVHIWRRRSSAETSESGLRFVDLRQRTETDVVVDELSEREEEVRQAVGVFQDGVLSRDDYTSHRREQTIGVGSAWVLC